MKCKTCGKNAESEYCFLHKPRKPLPVNKQFTKGKSDGQSETLHNFFIDLWNKRKKHDCENCGKWLGKEPLSYMFDHILEKSKHPDLKFEEDNIMFLCLECHDNKTRGNLTDFIKNKIQEIRMRFDK